MYSKKRNGFSVLDLLVKIIFAGIFIFILIWLFNRKVPNMKPFYSNVFRENIKYMQDAGEAYFTDDKMPKEVGQEVKITLSEMFDKKLVLPFVDEDGNSCNQYNSYVSVTKLEEGYELKTNLVCNKQSDYLVKILGCHNYCKDSSCAKTCSIEKITQYQYKKLVSGPTTNYSCDSGYSLDGKYCYKTTLVDSKSAEKQTTDTKIVTVDAHADITEAKTTQLKTVVTTKKTYVDVNKTSKKTYVDTVLTDKKVYYKKVTFNEKQYVDAVKTTGKQYVDATKTGTKQYVDAVKTTNPSTTKQVPYSCTKYKTERKCTPYSYSEPYTCNCTSSVGPTGKTVTSCSTCYHTVSGESCSNVQTPYTATCYKTETVPGSTTYSCPSGATAEGSGSSLKCYKMNYTYSCPSGTTAEGSGSSLKCYKNTTTYSCPSGAKAEGSGSSLKCYKVVSVTRCHSTTTAEGDRCYRMEKVKSCPSGSTAEGSGDSLKCYKTTTTYSCPSGATAEGSGSSLKCYKNVTTYSCPSGTDTQTGSGASLKCYKVESGSVRYYCDAGYKLNGKKCSKEVTTTTTTYSCDDGYKLEGTKCNKYETDKVKATATSKDTSYYTYKWSESDSLSGWTKTGKTQTVDGEEVCK